MKASSEHDATAPASAAAAERMTNFLTIFIRMSFLVPGAAAEAGRRIPLFQDVAKIHNNFPPEKFFQRIRRFSS
jgi:hypothetical protein